MLKNFLDVPNGRPDFQTKVSTAWLATNFHVPHNELPTNAIKLSSDD